MDAGLVDPLAVGFLRDRRRTDADDARVGSDRAVAAGGRGIGGGDDHARAGLDPLVADRELGPAGNDHVRLLMARVGLVVLDVERFARFADDRVHAERLHAERTVQLLPAAVLGRLHRMLGQIDEWHCVPLDVVVSGRCPG